MRDLKKLKIHRCYRLGTLVGYEFCGTTTLAILTLQARKLIIKEAALT